MNGILYVSGYLAVGGVLSLLSVCVAAVLTKKVPKQMTRAQVVYGVALWPAWVSIAIIAGLLLGCIFIIEKARGKKCDA